ncbi:co-chaperone HscB [Moellerella wisconsensis]|uniref:Co-chaperone protein HscB n=3 Tax=Moellerella wisconsensis TaxID=158849 RepID=A0A0N1KJ24_9GAMM|nr:co-chaperone HscB [Moellerella wisconsensis]KLN96795.1 co-chaperone HscB [Moellerella wisconsensis]KPD03025.1 HscB family chaperone protein [Moellerella wisconsensis ATCC 35017]UNH23276.1 co-chaperone HscB [Moellerella wisconsensis]UNH26354.1 co-chaperone HscB [Moellerella wisconsensis]UNH29768.1 co-chaperone HscB [Moellerella wisconsensis]
MDYFTLFGLDPVYAIDREKLTQRYQELQRQYHPDRFATQSEQDKMQALQQAATINSAYQSLRHPLKRAEYMLSLHDYDINNEQHTMHDTAFLIEQLELREELDTIENSPQAETLLTQFLSNVAQMIASRMALMEQQIAAKNWEQAADTVRKLRFLDKLQQQAQQLEERLFDDF